MVLFLRPLSISSRYKKTPFELEHHEKFGANSRRIFEHVGYEYPENRSQMMYFSYAFLH